MQKLIKIISANLGKNLNLNSWELPFLCLKSEKKPMLYMIENMTIYVKLSNKYGHKYHTTFELIIDRPPFSTVSTKCTN